MLMGFLMASIVSVGFIDCIMIHAIIDYFIAAGTAAYNHSRTDGLMNRTKTRLYRLSEFQQKEKYFSKFNHHWFRIFNLVYTSHAAAVSLSTTLIYLVLYTPMKQKTAFNIIIGAIPGAYLVLGGGLR